MSEPIEPVILEECESTNDIAKAMLAKGAVHATSVLSKRQTLGRGRSGHSWESMTGNLHYSFIVRDFSPSTVTCIPLLASLSVVRLLKRQWPELEALGIKWPNDLYLHGKKFGGILCEGNSLGLVIGIGINLATSPDYATDLNSWVQSPLLTPEDFARTLSAQLKTDLAQFKKDGFSGMVSDYEQFLVFKPGEFLSWSDGRNKFKGRYQKIGPLGECVVELENGREERLVSQEVSVVRTSN